MDNTDYRDFVGKELQVGDYVIYTQKTKYGAKPLAYGIVEELGGVSHFEEPPKSPMMINGVPYQTSQNIGQYIREFPCSVVVKRVVPRLAGKYKEHFPCDAKLLIKVSQGDIMLKVLAEGTSDFLKG
jgi:hypothetical protein